MSKCCSKYAVKKIDAKTAKSFIRKHHYTHGCHNGPFPCYGLFDGESLIGCMMFATPCSENVRRLVLGGGQKNATIELHRLYIKDVTPKNTESWFIKRCLKQLKIDRPETKVVVSFSDKTEGHCGTIYAAANFIKTGHTKPTIFFRDKDGRLRHPRQNGVNLTVADAASRGWEPERRMAKTRWHYPLGGNKWETQKLRNILVEIRDRMNVK